MTTSTLIDKDRCIGVCNNLLQGERSAVETYTLVLKKFSANGAAPELTRLRNEHAAAVRQLEDNVRQMGGVPDSGSGLWGKFAKSVERAAQLFGAESAMAALQLGEAHGRVQYQQALEDESVLPECKEMISTCLFPQTKEHIATLERLQHGEMAR
tara:strand:+ start:6629 stop:7093 length:465 start_codon:yes stop_codon:yes gene_type:complete